VSRTLAYGGPVVDESYPPIEGYAVIGDCRSAALISKAGSLDWLCLPRFDSPSRFGALLDREKGGHFTVRPTKPFTSERRYLQGTNVLETTFTTANGRVVLTDLMPVGSEADRRAELWPDRQVLRRVEGLEGEVEIEVVCDPRPEYGARLPRMEGRGSLGIYYNDGADVLVLRSEVPLTLSEDGAGARGRATLAPGERRWLSLVHSHGEPAVIPPFGEAADRKLAATIRWWSEWSGRCRYDGPYREAVVRSALTLKLMSYAPSGAIIAAPTTSLPEWIGSVRNWDYRYCWLRDASLTLQSLMGLGYREEAESFLSWMLHTTHLTWPELHVLYDVYGGTRLEERELSHLEGYAGSSPVRVGNGAADQLQLDIYGELISAVYEVIRLGGSVAPDVCRFLPKVADQACDSWHERDYGIWELRNGPFDFVYSKAMVWAALDRALKLADRGVIDGDTERWKRIRAQVRADLLDRGFDAGLGAFKQSYERAVPDASNLLIPMLELLPFSDPRVTGTIDVVMERLCENDLVYRYLSDDGVAGGEGAFVFCTFWLVDVLALSGRIDEARRIFEGLAARANHVGLYSEQIDPATGAFLGNFPQAFSHIGLINSALYLAHAEGRETPIPAPIGSAEHREESADEEDR
jgi:GH15 family glucan-1,4-alpha-glucosidase